MGLAFERKAVQKQVLACLLKPKRQRLLVKLFLLAKSGSVFPLTILPIFHSTFLLRKTIFCIFLLTSVILTF